MNYLQFRQQFIDLICFNTNQIYVWQANFDKSNLTRWTKQNLLLKCRNGFYSFPEYQKTTGIQYFISNKIYRPSYISLHSALAFYGIIPESIVQTTAISSLKKASFENSFGNFSYHQILPELMFGYEQKPFLNSRSILFATPEKAILDLLYLYPFYNNEAEISELRFDEDFMQNELNVERLMDFAQKFQSKALQKRVDILLSLHV